MSRLLIEDFPFQSIETLKEDKTMLPIQDFDPSIQNVDQALGEVDRLLHQMLLLAELSASDLDVARDVLQKILERLQRRIDRIMEGISGSI